MLTRLPLLMVMSPTLTVTTTRRVSAVSSSPTETRKPSPLALPLVAVRSVPLRRQLMEACTPSGTPLTFTA